MRCSEISTTEVAKMNNPATIRTKALVLRRTNYGEADRILNILTPEGKMAVLAKGVRREKSRLAGGIEMFCLSEVVVHRGRGELMILTAAKSLKFYRNLLKDYERMEAAAEMLKKMDKASEAVSDERQFNILQQALLALDDGANLVLAKAWFYLNLAAAMGEQINLYTDIDGVKLEEGEHYKWNTMEKVLEKNERGVISTDTIKMLRLMLSADLALCLKVKLPDEGICGDALFIAESLNVI